MSLINVKLGHIIVNTRPGGAEVYLDGRPVLDSQRRIAKTPSLLLGISEGAHNVTFIRQGYNDTTVSVNVSKDEYAEAYAILNTTMMRYPATLQPDQTGQPYPNDSPQQIQNSQPAPGWPALPIPQVPYGHIVANTIPDGAEVYVDGQPVFDSLGRVATTPVTVLDISAGIHKVTFKKQGYFDDNVDVLIQNGLYSDVSAVLRLRMAPQY